MTVSYSQKIATVRYGSFARLLFLWHGGVYKAVWPGILIFCAIYSVVALIYQAIPSSTLEYLHMKRQFVRLCVYAGRISSAIPASFVLGFYVNLVVKRWWKQFLHLPTPDAISLLLTAYLNEPERPTAPTSNATQTKRSVHYRRQIIRYMNLSSLFCFNIFSVSVKRRFPTLDSLVDARLMTDEEKQIYAKHGEGKPFFFVPIVWAVQLLSKAYQEGLIRNPRQMDAILQEMLVFRGRIAILFLHHLINVPLVYNQVVALAVYLYFAVCVLSQQFADPRSMLEVSDPSFAYLYSQPPYNMTFNVNHTFYTPIFNATVEEHHNIIKSALDVLPNIPIFTILALVFYDGWLKVAEAHVFPFGDDDNDFDVIPLAERNVRASLWMVDRALGDPDLVPEFVKTGCRTKGLDDQIDDSRGDLIVHHHHHHHHPQNSDIHLNPILKEAHKDDSEDDLNEVSSYRRSSAAEIPDLPCPESLRRRVSQNFFHGSLAFIYDNEVVQRRKARKSIAYMSHTCTPSSCRSSITDDHSSWNESPNQSTSNVHHASEAENK